MDYPRTHKGDIEGMGIPDSVILEKQVLSDLVYNPDLLPTVRAVVSKEMFTSNDMQRAWEILNEMENKGLTIDLATFGAKVDKNTLQAILDQSPALYNGTMDHCRALADMFIRRIVFMRSYEMMKKAEDPGTDIAGLLAMPGNLMSDLEIRTTNRTEAKGIIDILNSYADELQDRANGTIRKIPTGFGELNKILMGGWTAGNLIVLSGRPSVGKSSVMMQMSLSAGRAGFPATIYSLEMPYNELAERLIWSTGHVRPRDTSEKNVRSLDWVQYEKANGELSNLPMLYNTGVRTLDEICNDIVMQHQRGRCEIAFIDHLHIISGQDNQRSSYQAITERTRRLKNLAMDVGIPVVLLCQLNRMSDMENRPPDLRDLRDSGSIEQDADIVLMLDRPSKDRSNPNVDMWVRKNRNGKAGEIRVELTGDMSRGFTVFTERNTLDNNSY